MLVSEQRPKQYWLIAKYEGTGIEVLTANLIGGQEALPVFSFKEEAGIFFDHRALGSRWRIRETTAGELVSILYGPCAYIERIALDPISDMEVEAWSYLASMRREDFVDFLVSKQKLRISSKELGPSCRTPISV